MILFVLMLAPASINAQYYVSEADMFLDARPIIFTVNRTEIHTEDSLWIADTLVHNLEVLGDYGIVYGRAAASPEGPIPNNKRLANGRRNAAVSYLLSHGFDATQIQFETITEDYGLLLSMMAAANDSDYVRVRTLVEMYPTDEAPLKRALKKLRNGEVWERLLKVYYPKLRAVRIIATERMKPISPVFGFDAPDPKVLKPLEDVSIELPNLRSVTPWQGEPSDKQRYYRREMFAVKTNALMYVAYMPQYGWCPMPNGELEFYPLHGHFTAGVMYDKPWWIHYDRHEFFELENTTLYLRYYLRNGDIRYRTPGEGAAYTGWYGALYGHWFRYQIGLSKDKGWVGEGGGPGLGIGYVLPISKDGHWRLDFGAQFGFFRTKYDPFVYGTPVERDESSDLYYYDIKYHPSLFKRRQNHFNWFGPTRIGISLSYDLLYRKGKDRGLRFKKWYEE